MSRRHLNPTITNSPPPPANRCLVASRRTRAAAPTTRLLNCDPQVPLSQKICPNLAIAQSYRLNPLLTALYDELVIREPRDHSPDMSIGPNDKQKSLGKRLSIKDFGNANQPPGSSQPAGPKDQVPSSTPDPSKTHIRKKGSMMSLQSMFKPAGQKQPQAANPPGPQPNRANENGKRRISLVNDTKSKAKRLKNSGKKFFNRIETAAKGARRCIRDKYNRLVCPRPTNVSPMNAAFENSARPDDSQLVPPPPLLGESGRTQSEESFYNKMQPLERMGGRHEVPTYHNEGASSPTDHFNHPATGTNPGNAANSPAGMRSPGDAASSSARVHDSSAVDRPQSYASVLGSDGGYSSGDSDEDSEGPPQAFS